MKFTWLKLFLGAVGLALVVYGITLPSGTPWGVAGYCEYTWLLAAFAAGLIAVLVNAYVGWRFAATAAIGWVFFPRIWNGAILGNRFALLASCAIIGICILNLLGLVIFHTAIAVHRKAEIEGRTDMTSSSAKKFRGLINVIAGYVFLAAAIGGAIYSMIIHDYRLGSAAPAFARDIASAAGDRIIVMDGICDEQVMEQVESRKEKVVGKEDSAIHNSKFIVQHSQFSFPGFPCLNGHSLEPDYRERVLIWTRHAFPADTNLAVAAQISVANFVDVATKAHPECFFVMEDGSEPLEAWNRRWVAFKPYLKSRDRFVPSARRAFAFSLNGIANNLHSQPQPSTSTSLPWELYWKILNEVEPGNIAALINLNTMVQKGFAATDFEKKRIKQEISEFFGDRNNLMKAMFLVRQAGPLRSDPELVARLAEEHRQHFAKLRHEGMKLALSERTKKLIETNNEMINALEEGDVGKAGRLARKILSVPALRGFIPANVAMGAASAKSGDYVAAESFYKTATATTNATPASVWNDYADTLMNLGRLDEAEKLARKAIANSGDNFFVARLTLAEILSQKRKLLEKVFTGVVKGEIGNDQMHSIDEDAATHAKHEAIEKEIRELVESVLLSSPDAGAFHVRASQRSGNLLK